jgi:hypothetical protein
MRLKHAPARKHNQEIVVPGEIFTSLLHISSQDQLNQGKQLFQRKKCKTDFILTMPVVYIY